MFLVLLKVAENKTRKAQGPKLTESFDLKSTSFLIASPDDIATHMLDLESRK